MEQQGEEGEEARCKGDKEDCLFPPPMEKREVSKAKLMLWMAAKTLRRQLCPPASPGWAAQLL